MKNKNMKHEKNRAKGRLLWNWCFATDVQSLIQTIYMIIRYM